MKENSRLTDAILETAEDMQEGGILSEKEYEKITMRHAKLPKIEPISSEEIRDMRKREHLSQAVFAGGLHLTVGYISQLERGVKKPKGAVLVLLNVIRNKGFNFVIH